jgi:hypothetical protein
MTEVVGEGIKEIGRDNEGLKVDARKSRSRHKAKKIKSPPSQVQKFN